ncbi:MAG: hypothetical protein UW68_C0039G0011 [Candidatus Collierbacteria bacterium GW2011_GWB1_44_6]|uniref:Uncharacterized protein n=2 Tax=Candidatus Collieribacteriota TaxID=1752725 RepID=A0A0G1JLW1_9BACT|nr:MAG: hypothetical protein UW68_C0039G0011 [Candidatus Collierbacteria bacterium GW2011_GWB1_44_6]
MIFEFPANEFSPKALAEIWIQLRAIGWDRTSELTISEAGDGNVRIECGTDPASDDLTEMEPVLFSMGGVQVLPDKADTVEIEYYFPDGDFDPREVALLLEDLATVCLRVFKHSVSSTITRRESPGTELVIRMTEEQEREVFMGYHFDKQFERLNGLRINKP